MSLFWKRLNPKTYNSKLIFFKLDDMLTWFLYPEQKISNRIDLAFFGRMNHHDCGADCSETAADFSYCGEFFFEKLRGHDRTHKNTKSTEWRDKRGGHETVCSEIAQFTYSHCFFIYLLFNFHHHSHKHCEILIYFVKC